jgi:1,4-dihydroxy-2-naphthoate octaprenyltransferase
MTVATNSMKAWVLASRPKTLGAISCPIIIGNALANYHGQFSWGSFFLTLTCGLILQVLANVVNDYGDFIKGSDKADRLGPPRAMQMGWITKNAMSIGMAVLLGIALMLGLWLVYLGGPVILALGAVAILLCFAYTLGPVPIAYFGFAEVIIFVVFGPMIVLGSYFVQTKGVAFEALAASIAPGLMAAALLLTNNLRDMVQDERNRKRTIAVRFGDGVARGAIVAFLLLALFCPVGMVVFFALPKMILLACCALVIPLRCVPMIAKDPISGRFNLMLASIGKALYLFGILFAIGLSYGAA